MIVKTLVWSDIHNRIDILSSHLDKNFDSYDEVVFLGDWFDSFNEKSSQTEASASYLKELLKFDKCIFLFGNHDIHYAQPALISLSPGFSHEKLDLIDKILDKDEWNNFRMFYKTQVFYCSHAGLSEEIFGSKLDEGDLDKLFKLELANYRNNNPSRYIGDLSKFSKGVLWCRYNDFKPINNYNQIFGHTILDNPKTKYIRTKGDGKLEYRNQKLNEYRKNPPKMNKISSQNWCIDTNNRHYIIIEDSVISVHSTKA